MSLGLTLRQAARRRRSSARRRHRIILALLFIVLAFALGPISRLLAGETPEGTAAPSAEQRLIYHLKVPKEIGRIMTTYLTRGFREAEQAGADLVVVELDTPGGTLSGSVKGSKVISSSTIPTVAWVHHEATSGGAMLAFACKDIVVAKPATIGDVIPITIGSGGEIIEAPEKIVGYVSQFMRSNAEASGHDPDLAEAMVRKSMKIRYDDYAAKMAAKGIQLGIPPQYRDDPPEAPAAEEETPASTAPEAAPPEGAALEGASAEDAAPAAGIVEPTADDYGKEYITKRDEILNLTWREALFLRLAIGRAAAIDHTPGGDSVECITDIDKFRHLRGARIVSVGRNWSEDVSEFLSSPGIVVLLLIGAFVGIGTELKVPGFGFPGILGIICLVLLFFGQLGAGAAAWTDLILLLIGLVLLGIELFLIPGFGIVGILGIICILGGLFMMLTENPPKTPEKFPVMPTQFLSTALLLCIAIIGSGIALFLLYYFVLPRTQFLGALVLTSQQKHETGYHASEGTALADPARLVGRIGVAKTKLRPAGRAVFDGEPYDVMSQGDFIDPGTEVQIVEVKSNRIMVRKAHGDQTQHTEGA
jgi:membrane-bound serine protease (ClpP class)